MGVNMSVQKCEAGLVVSVGLTAKLSVATGGALDTVADLILRAFPGKYNDGKPLDGNDAAHLKQLLKDKVVTILRPGKPNATGIVSRRNFKDSTRPGVVVAKSANEATFEMKEEQPPVRPRAPQRVRRARGRPQVHDGRARLHVPQGRPHDQEHVRRLLRQDGLRPRDAASRGSRASGAWTREPSVGKRLIMANGGARGQIPEPGALIGFHADQEAPRFPVM